MSVNSQTRLFLLWRTWGIPLVWEHLLETLWSVTIHLMHWSISLRFYARTLRGFALVRLR